jgi:hypothetical protein
MKKEEIEKVLFISESAKYGDKYIEHLLDQYKIYINAAEKISDRRQKTNEFFLGLNTALVALLGFIATKTNQSEIGLMLGISAIAGITICYLWFRIIASYKGLNSAKFKVIHAIEMRLPLALYDTEWEMLGRGEDKKIYWPFSHIELHVPKIFIIIYFALILSLVPYSIFQNITISSINIPTGLDGYLNIASVTLSLLGSLAFAKGLFISQKEALRLGVSRLSGDTDEENLKLPQVEDRLTQRKWGIIGATLLVVGFVLQILVLI